MKKNSEEDFHTADSSSALDALMNEDDEQPKQKRKYTRRTKAETSLDVKAENVALITKGILAAAEGITRMPFKEVDEDIKKSFDEAAAQCANLYGGEYVQKYMPVIQLTLCASLIVSTTYQKHLQHQRQLEHEQPND